MHHIVSQNNFTNGDLYTFAPGNGLGIRVVGGKEIPGSHGEIGAYIAKVMPGGVAEQTGKVVEGKMRIREEGGINTTVTSGMKVIKIQARVCGSEKFSFKIKT